MANIFNKANNWVKQFEHFVEAVGYSAANAFGMGEQANTVVNEMKKIAGSDPRTITMSTAQLISYLKDKVGSSAINLQKLINIIDSKLSMLPNVTSQNVKKALAGERSKLLKARRQAATELSRVEQTMNTGSALASQQDYLNPAKKLENQELVNKLVGSQKGKEVAESVERTI